MLAPREETPPKAEGKLSSCNRLFINRLQPIPVLGSIATHGPIPMLFEQLPQSSMVPNDHAHLPAGLSELDATRNADRPAGQVQRLVRPPFPLVGPYFPVNTGFRFSRKARIPSR
jgi:hypothetical protein